MPSRECEEQLKRLIYDWETEGLLTKINATDIEAIKHLMLENEIQQDTIKTQKLVIGNLSDRVTKVIEYLENDLQSFLYSVEYKTLLDLLKGENNER